MRTLDWRVEIPSTEALRKALEGLKPQTPPHWGKMNSSAMLLHVADFGALYFGEREIDGATRVLGRWIGGFFLQSLTRKSPLGGTPKNLRTLPSIDPRKQHSTADWEALKNEVVEMFNRLDALNSPVTPHPIYGEMRTEDFVALIRHHSAHHFHQFGLI